MTLAMGGLLSCLCEPSAAQIRNDSIRICFRQGKASIDTNYHRNAADLLLLKEALIHRNHPMGVTRVTIEGWTSPEGGWNLNRRLAEQRAIAVGNELVPLSRQDGSAALTLEILPRGSDWKRIYGYAQTDRQLPFRQETLDLLQQLMDTDGEGAQKQNDSLLKALQLLRGGLPYRYLYGHAFPGLRAAVVRWTSYPEWQWPLTSAEPPPLLVDGELAEGPVLMDTLRGLSQGTPRKKPFYWTLKTNLLYDALLLPNISAECYLGKHWTAAVNWIYTWLKTDRKHRYWRIYGGEVEINRWFQKPHHNPRPFSGHHLGVYGQLLTYDIEWGARGYQGRKWTYGGGLTYGYAFPIARRLNLDCALSCGYLQGKCMEYVPYQDRYLWQKTRTLRWIGPTQLAINLVWRLGRGNDNLGRERR